MGDIPLWKVGCRKWLVLRIFEAWDLGFGSMPLTLLTKMKDKVFSYNFKNKGAVSMS